MSRREWTWKYKTAYERTLVARQPLSLLPRIIHSLAAMSPTAARMQSTYVRDSVGQRHVEELYKICVRYGRARIRRGTTGGTHGPC